LESSVCVTHFKIQIKYLLAITEEEDRLLEVQTTKNLKTLKTKKQKTPKKLEKRIRKTEKTT